MEHQSITKQTLQRLPLYLNYLNGLNEKNVLFISSSTIAHALSFNDVVVRKDLASVCSYGKPRIGYPLTALKEALSTFLGYRDTTDAVLVGAGQLGRALIGYKGFKEFGLNIVAAFDAKESAEPLPNDVPLFPVEKTSDLCTRLQVLIGIITTPDYAAQESADRLIEGGVLAIWNFTTAHLKVKEGILVQNENMAASLAILSNHLKDALL